jgi:hypothetical protein
MEEKMTINMIPNQWETQHYLGDKVISEKTFAHLILEKTLVS